MALPLQRIDREEIGSAGVPGALVIGHGGMVAAAFMRRNALRLLHPTRAGPGLRCFAANPGYT
jgi:hypothetical protein